MYAVKVVFTKVVFNQLGKEGDSEEHFGEFTETSVDVRGKNIKVGELIKEKL